MKYKIEALLLRFVRWFVGKYLPGYHISKNPLRKQKES